MEVILELLIEIFVVGVVEFAKSKKANNLLRFIIMAFAIFIVVTLFYVSYVLRDNIWEMIVALIFASISGIYTYHLHKEFRKVDM